MPNGPKSLVTVLEENERRIGSFRNWKPFNFSRCDTNCEQDSFAESMRTIELTRVRGIRATTFDVVESEAAEGEKRRPQSM